MERVWNWIKECWGVEAMQGKKKAVGMQDCPETMVIVEHPCHPPLNMIPSNVRKGESWDGFVTIMMSHGYLHAKNPRDETFVQKGLAKGRCLNLLWNVTDFC